MTKLLSLLLSFSILFTSIAPSYAQAVQPSSRFTTEDLNRRVQRDIVAKSDNTQVHNSGTELPLIVDNFNRRYASDARYQEMKKFEEYVRILTQDAGQGGEFNEESFNAAYKAQIEESYQQALDSNSEAYQQFKREYKQQIQTTYYQQREGLSAEGLKLLDKWREETLQEETITKLYQESVLDWKTEMLSPNKMHEAYLKAKQEMDEETANFKNIILKLGKDTLKYEYPLTWSTTNIEAIRIKDPISEILPVFASVGIIDPEVRSKAAQILRRRIQSKANSCERPGFIDAVTENQKPALECQQVLRDVVALGILGKEQEDAKTIAQVLQAGYRGALGANVILTVGSTLMAMDDNAAMQDWAASAFFSALSQIIQKVPYSALEITGSVLSIESWVKMFHAAAEDNASDFVIEGTFVDQWENSFIKSQDTSVNNLENAWVELGIEIADKAREKSGSWKSALDSFVSRDLVHLHSRGGGVFVGVANKLLLTGLLFGKYKVALQQGGQHQVMNAQGKVSYQNYGSASDAIHTWNDLNRQLGINQTEALAIRLYFTGMSDLDPYTARYMKNLLYYAFHAQNGGQKTVKGMEATERVLESELAKHKRWQAAEQLGAVADWTLIAIGVVVGGSALIKAGTNLASNMTRSISLARSAVASGRAASMPQALSRVTRLARFYKYGTTSAVELMRGRAAFAVRSMSSKVGLPFNEVRVPRPPVAAARTASQASAASRAAAATTIELNGELRMLPEGYRYVCVGEEGYVLVENSESLKSLTQRFGRVVREVKPGEKLATTPTQTPYNYSMGAGVSGSKGSQPVMPNTAASSATPKVTPSTAPKAATSVASEATTSTVSSSKKIPVWQERFLWWRVGAEDMFSSLGHSVRNWFGAATLSLGFSVMPVGSEAINATFSAMRGAPINMTLNPMRAQNMFITGAIPTNFGKGANAGAMAIRSATRTATAATAGTTIGTGASFGSFARNILMFRSGTGLVIPFHPTYSPAASLNQNTVVIQFHPNYGNTTTANPSVEENVAPASNQGAVVIPFRPTYENTEAANTPSDAAAEAAPVTTAEQTVAPQQNASGNLYSSIFPFSPIVKVVTNAWNYLRSKISSTENSESATPLHSVPWWKKLGIFGTEKQRANNMASRVLSQRYPLVSSLKNILQSQASDSYKVAAIFVLYQQGVLSQIITNLTEQTRQKIQQFVNAGQWEALGELLLSLYRTGVISAEIDVLEDNTSSAALLDEVGSIVNTPDFRRQAMARFNQLEVLSAAEGSFEGNIPLPTKTDIEAIASTFRDKEGFTIPEGVERGDVVYYKTNIPFYYRNSQGELSREPVGILSQESASTWNVILSKVPWRLFADKPGFSIPKGLVLVLDEQGQWKLMVQPGKLAVAESTQTSRKVLEEIRAQGSKRVAVDTPYTTDQLLAMAKVLEANPDRRLQLVLNAPSSFRQFLNIFGAYIGLDSANSLTGPYKKTLGVTSVLKWPAVAITNFISGIGYMSPWIGGKALQFMTKWGYSKSILTLFGVAGAALLGSWIFMGMDGTSEFEGMVREYQANPENMQLLFSIAGQLALPLIAAVFTGSLFGALVPIILNIYKDPTARTAANLKFASTKQYSRLFLTVITGATIALGGDWTIMVPIATGLLVASAILFFNTPIMKNAKMEQEKALNKKAEMEEQWRAAGENVEEKRREQESLASAERAAFRENYKTQFKYTPEVKEIISRVRGVYWAYAASLMMIGQMATELAGKGGQWITAGFMFVTALMRTYSKKLVSAKKKTDDQLTGMSIPLLAISAALLTVLPYQFSWIGLATALAAAAHYVGTAVPGQLDNTRMQNMVSAMIQEEKQKIQDDTNLTEAQREEELERVNRKEKEWASLASASYSYANGWGLFGVLVAVGLGFLLNDIPAMEALLQNFSINVDYGAMVNEFLSNVREGISSLFSWFAPADLYTSESNSLTMQRFVFLMSTGALSYLAVKNWDLTRDFFRGLRKPKVTTETIQAGKVNASTFGISAKNAAQNLTKIGKEIQSMKDRLVAFGVISEKKMTDLYNQLVMTYNRLNAVREVQGMSPMVQSTFDKLFEVSRSYASLLGKHKMSVMLERQFQKFSETISKEGTLETLAETPVYMAEGEYALPQAYEKFEEAKLLIQEMNQLAGKIRDNNVRSDTYKLFIQYYNRVRDNLTLYGKLNLADSNRVLLMEQELEQLCRALKKGDAMSGILETNKGPVSSSDVQLLRDLLQGVPEASAAY